MLLNKFIVNIQRILRQEACGSIGMVHIESYFTLVKGVKNDIFMLKVTPSSSKTISSPLYKSPPSSFVLLPFFFVASPLIPLSPLLPPSSPLSPFVPSPPPGQPVTGTCPVRTDIKGMDMLLLIQAGMATAGAIWAVFFFRREPATPPSKVTRGEEGGRKCV